MIDNPVLWKELKAKFRWRQTPQVKAAAVAIILLFLVYGYWQVFAAIIKWSSGDSAKAWWQVGVSLHGLIIWLLCPALASNAITQEKEQQTWDMLIFTQLRPSEILSGKLLSRLLPILGIIVVFLPYMLFCVARGGAQLGEFLLVYVIFATWVLFLVTTSLFMSWAFRKTATSIAMSYMVVFALVIGTALIEATITAGGHYNDSPVLWLNPVRVIAAVFDRNDHNSTGVLLLSTFVYLAVTALLYWRMHARFRDFSIE
jgi:ABC-type transport system involved in multi-copper enzyme maturation permease subunit